MTKEDEQMVVDEVVKKVKPILQTWIDAHKEDVKKQIISEIMGKNHVAKVIIIL